MDRCQSVTEPKAQLQMIGQRRMLLKRWLMFCRMFWCRLQVQRNSFFFPSLISNAVLIVLLMVIPLLTAFSLTRLWVDSGTSKCLYLRRLGLAACGIIITYLLRLYNICVIQVLDIYL